MKFDPSEFRAHFPEFSNPGVWTDARLEMQFEEASCYVYPDAWCSLRGKCQTLAIYLIVAHLCQLSHNQLMAASCTSNQAGIITAATINKISVTLLAPPTNSAWDYWLNQTPYGQRLLALLRVRSRGGMAAGLAPERAGFRKAGGVF